MSTHAEILLISSVLRDQDMPVAFKMGIATDQFHACPDEWDWLERYYMKHKKTPSKVAFKTQFPEFSVKAVNDTAHFAVEVRKAHAQQALTTAMRNSAGLIASGNLDQALTAMQGSMVSISAGMGDGNDDSDIITSWQDTFDEVDRRVDRVNTFGMAGIPTGFTTLDDRTGGAQPGQSWIVGARLGSGKSWAMMRMATAAIINGYSVQYLALEQTRTEVAMRMHSFLSGAAGKQIFNNMDLAQGKGFDLGEYREFLYGMKDTIAGRMHVSDTSRGMVTPMSIAAQIERNKPDIVFIDYLTLMQGAKDWQAIGEISGQIKNLAQQYQIPIVSASQLNRSAGIGGKEIPGAEALSQADAIGQDADAVVNMRMMSATTVQMKLVKYRHGNSGYKWWCHFNPGKGIFNECSYDEALALKDIDDAANDDD